MSELDKLMEADNVLGQAFSEAATGSLLKSAGFEGQIYGAENNVEAPTVKGPDINGPGM